MCFEIYDSSVRWPKLLPCQHTFCQPCLQLLDKNQRINCPQCRIDHITPQGGAKQLPNNFTMLSLIDLHRKTASVPSPSASNGDAQEQARINENVRNAVGGLAQKLQQKASDLSKIDEKRKKIEEKFLAVKAQLDSAFDARAKELQVRRETLIKQLASLRQEELNFLEGQKASATQYLQKFQQDFAGMRESLLAQQRLPNEMELNNLLTMCRGYMQQIDKYALNLDQKDHQVAFIDPTKQQLSISINGYGCVKINLSGIGGSGDATISTTGQSLSTNISSLNISNNQNLAPSQSLRSNMSAPSLLTSASSTSTSTSPSAAVNNNINRSASGPNFNNGQSSGSSQYMFPPSPRSIMQAQGQNAAQRGQSPYQGGSSVAPSSLAIAPRTSPSTSPHSSRSVSPNPNVSNMNTENSGDRRRRSLNPFLQESSPNSLSQSQAIPSLSSPTTTPSGSIGASVTPIRGHSPLPNRPQVSMGSASNPTQSSSRPMGSIPSPTQSASRPAQSRTRHASLDIPTTRPPHQFVDPMSAISELSSSSSNPTRNTSVNASAASASFPDPPSDSPPPLPPRKGAKASNQPASTASSSTKQWVQFDTLRRNSSPTKSQSVKVIGSGWLGGGFFEKPVGAVSLPNNLIAALDERNHCVIIVSETGQLVRTLGAKGNGPGQFQFPRGICTNTAGHVIVSDWFNNRIQLWEPSGKFVRQFGVRGQANQNLNGPVGVVCDQSDNIYVCDYNNHCVKVFNAAGGFIRQIGKPGHGDGQFQSPSHIVISPGGELLITDASKHCVQVFTKQGTFLYAVGQWGTGSGQLNCPTGITIDHQGYLYVANSGNHRIEVFNPSGSFSMSLGTQGKEEGQFDEPLGVTTTEDGRLIVCDSGNKRLQILWP